MSSGFVRAGTDQEPVEHSSDWLQAQQQIEATRRRKEDEGKQAGGKSLYEVLQANKAAKQEAFEESIRLKNHFRSLDEDEVDFLDSVLESTRAKEAEVRKETAEQLEIFRKQREAADELSLAVSQEKTSEGSPEVGETWTTNPKKRRRDHRKDEPESKLRKSSSNFSKSLDSDKATVGVNSTKPAIESPRIVKAGSGFDKSVATEDQNQAEPSVSQPATLPNKPISGLALDAYSSDDD
ncbi:MAG: hypothetical protein Q9227_008255 [Pyrenula ochraceoflavens]